MNSIYLIMQESWVSHGELGFCSLPEEARSINDPVWKYSDSKFKLLFFQVDKLTTRKQPDMWKSKSLKLKFMYALRIYLRF